MFFRGETADGSFRIKGLKLPLPVAANIRNGLWQMPDDPAIIERVFPDPVPPMYDSPKLYGLRTMHREQRAWRKFDTCWFPKTADLCGPVPVNHRTALSIGDLGAESPIVLLYQDGEPGPVLYIRNHDDTGPARWVVAASSIEDLMSKLGIPPRPVFKDSPEIGRLYFTDDPPPPGEYCFHMDGARFPRYGKCFRHIKKVLRLPHYCSPLWCSFLDCLGDDWYPESKTLVIHNPGALLWKERTGRVGEMWALLGLGNRRNKKLSIIVVATRHERELIRGLAALTEHPPRMVEWPPGPHHKGGAGVEG